MLGNFENKRKQIYGDIKNQTEQTFNCLKRIKSLSFIVPKNVKNDFELISNKAIGIMIIKMNSLLINISNLHILKNTKLKIGIILRFLNWNK